MPMKSKAQWRKLFVLQHEGKLKPGTAEEFAHATRKSFKSLPEHVKKAGFIDQLAWKLANATPPVASPTLKPGPNTPATIASAQFPAARPLLPQGANQAPAPTAPAVSAPPPPAPVPGVDPNNLRQSWMQAVAAPFAKNSAQARDRGCGIVVKNATRSAPRATLVHQFLAHVGLIKRSSGPYGSPWAAQPALPQQPIGLPQGPLAAMATQRRDAMMREMQMNRLAAIAAQYSHTPMGQQAYQRLLGMRAQANPQPQYAPPPSAPATAEASPPPLPTQQPQASQPQAQQPPTQQDPRMQAWYQGVSRTYDTLRQQRQEAQQAQLGAMTMQQLVEEHPALARSLGWSPGSAQAGTQTVMQALQSPNVQAADQQRVLHQLQTPQALQRNPAYQQLLRQHNDALQSGDVDRANEVYGSMQQMQQHAFDPNAELSRLQVDLQHQARLRGEYGPQAQQQAQETQQHVDWMTQNPNAVQQWRAQQAAGTPQAASPATEQSPVAQTPPQASQAAPAPSQVPAPTTSAAGQAPPSTTSTPKGPPSRVSTWRPPQWSTPVPPRTASTSQAASPNPAAAMPPRAPAAPAATAPRVSTPKPSTGAGVGPVSS